MQVMSRLCMKTKTHKDAKLAGRMIKQNKTKKTTLNPKQIEFSVTLSSATKKDSAHCFAVGLETA